MDEADEQNHELADYTDFAQVHADTRQHGHDLNYMLRVAWEFMPPGQRDDFQGHPDVLALEDAVGGVTAAA